MAELGIPHPQIAFVIGASEKTLRKQYRTELELGSIEGNRQVLAALFSMATSGTNTTATLFWAKTRCGMREKPADLTPDEPPVTQLVFMEEAPSREKSDRGEDR